MASWLRLLALVNGSFRCGLSEQSDGTQRLESQLLEFDVINECSCLVGHPVCISDVILHCFGSLDPL